MLQVEIIGNLGRDAEVKDFNGRKFIAFNVAHSEHYKDNNGQNVERTVWVSCLKQGESGVVNYLKKGTPVFLRGDLSIKLYTDSNRQTQAGVNCLVRDLQLLPGKKNDQQPAAAPGTAPAPAPQPSAQAPASPAATTAPAPPAPGAAQGGNGDLPF